MTTTTQTATPRQQQIIASVETWHVAPEDQGQMIEMAYGLATIAERMVRRTIDRSSGETRYAIADAPKSYAPWNEAPQSDDWSDAIVLA